MTPAGFNWRLLAIASIVCSVLLAVGLVGTMMKTPAADTRLSGVPSTTEITDSFNTYGPSGKPVEPAPSSSTVVVEPAPAPASSRTVIVEPAPAPRPDTTIIVREPAPPPVEDLTVVIVKPEVRQPQQRIVLIDEGVERQELPKWRLGHKACPVVGS
jgi:hypothetical protein